MLRMKKMKRVQNMKMKAMMNLKKRNLSHKRWKTSKSMSQLQNIPYNYPWSGRMRGCVQDFIKKHIYFSQNIASITPVSLFMVVRCVRCREETNVEVQATGLRERRCQKCALVHSIKSI